MYYRCCLLIALQLKCALLEARATYAVLQGMGYESLMGMEKEILDPSSRSQKIENPENSFNSSSLITFMITFKGNSSIT